MSDHVPKINTKTIKKDGISQSRRTVTEPEKYEGDRWDPDAGKDFLEDAVKGAVAPRPAWASPGGSVHRNNDEP